MKTTIIPFTALTAFLLVGCNPEPPLNSENAPDRELVTQVSSYDALARGLYDGSATLESIRDRGDFGLGTLHGWDGEIVLLNGKYHLIDGNGNTREVTDFSATTPFLELTWFDEDVRKKLPAATTFVMLKDKPEAYLPDLNSIHAVRIEGKFRHLKTRSMFRQEKPYKVMSELVKTQPVFDFESIEGTMVGFWSPYAMNGVSLVGWHLHFLTKDGTAGGHVLEFETEDVVMSTDRSLDFDWHIPDTEEYRQTSFAPER